MQPAKVIRFPGGREALAVSASADQVSPSLLSGLGLSTPSAVVMLPGGEVRDGGAVAETAARAVAEAAVDPGAVIVGTGMEGSLSATAARFLREQGKEVPLIAVVSSAAGVGAPVAEEADVDPNQSHLLLVEEATPATLGAAMDAVAETLSGRLPVVVVLAGGDATAEEVARRAVRRGWPLVVLEGTGGTAGGIADALLGGRKSRPESPPEDLAEIVAGDVLLVPTDHSPQALERILRRRLQPQDSALRWAWSQFASYDYNAMRLRAGFQRLQLLILMVGVLATLLALTQSALLAHHVVHRGSLAAHTLHSFILVLPIALAALLGVAARFRSGNKWVDLRAAAEGVKREIFRYRTRTGHYGQVRRGHVSPDEVLTQQVAAISRALMQTDVNRNLLREPPSADLTPKRRGARSDDDRFFDLSPEQYLTQRVQDQIDYYRDRGRSLESRLRLLQALIFVIGGVGTLLAALHVDVWIALTTAIVAAITTYLGYEQVESTLINYNQANSALVSLKGWWEGLTPDAQASPEAWERLVDQGERILQREQGGWVQEMTDSLADLRAEQAKQQEGLEAPPPARR